MDFAIEMKYKENSLAVAEIHGYCELNHLACLTSDPLFSHLQFLESVNWCFHSITMAGNTRGKSKDLIDRLEAHQTQS